MQVHEGVDEIAISRAHSAADDVCGGSRAGVGGLLRAGKRWPAVPRSFTGAVVHWRLALDRMYAAATRLKPHRERVKPFSPEAPLMNLVSECTTMSAPNLRQRTQTAGWRYWADGLTARQRAGPTSRQGLQAAAGAGQQGQGSRATPSHRRGDSTKGVNVLSTTSLRLCGSGPVA